MKDIPVFIDGMHIDDNGMLVIDADEMDAAGVKSIELIEGTPEARIAELEARLKEAEEALEYKIEIAPDDLLATMLARAEKAELLVKQVRRIHGQAMVRVCGRAEKAEADAGRLRDAIEKVEWGWVSLGSGTYHEVCAWCRGFKQHGHKPDCARQSALSRNEQPEENQPPH